jgi:PAS domain S-box-containing protein
MLTETGERNKIVEIRIDQCYRDGAFAELAFTYAPVGLVVTENRRIRDCNLAFAEMFGYAPEELRDRYFAILYPSSDEFVNIRDRGVAQLRETNRYWDERIMARKDGSLFWCRVRGHTFTPDEPLMRAVWSFADLSELRPYRELTRREREIVSFLADGLTSKEIAQKLDLSYRTVEVYRAKLLKKFGATNTGALFQAMGTVDASHIVTR